MKQRLSALLASCALAFGLTGQAGAFEDYRDWWWNPDQSGMGLNVGQVIDILVVAWYFYEPDGSPAFLLFSGPLSGNVLAADLYRSTGPEPGTGFDPARVVRTKVGSATLTFDDPNFATLTYSYSGRSGTLSLQRFTYAIPVTSGTWAYTARGDASNCTSRANGSYYDSGRLNVFLETANLQFSNLSDNGADSCTFFSTRIPAGSSGFGSGSFSCNDGTSGEVSFSSIKLTSDFLTMNFVMQYTGGESCTIDGRLAALR